MSRGPDREAQTERPRPGVSGFQCRQTQEFSRREVAIDSLAHSVRSTPHPLFRDFERWSPAEIESFLRLAKHALSIQSEQPARTPRAPPLAFPSMQSKPGDSPVKRFPLDPRIRKGFLASIVPCKPRGRQWRTCRDNTGHFARALAGVRDSSALKSKGAVGRARLLPSRLRVKNVVPGSRLSRSFPLPTGQPHPKYFEWLIRYNGGGGARLTPFCQ